MPLKTEEAMVEESSKNPEEPVVEEDLSPKDDEPITGDEIRDVASDLYRHAKNSYLIPVRREVRGWFRAGKDFLTGLGDDTDKKGN